MSINLCSDQLLIELADAEQILSLSMLSHEAEGSHHYQTALRFPVNNGLAEEVLQLQPDIVIAGQYTNPYTIRLLRASGLTVERIAIADSFETLFENLRQIGRWTGQQARTEHRVQALQERLSALPPVATDVVEPKEDEPPPMPRPRVAIYDPNGYTAGTDSLRGQMLQLAGWQNVAAEAGIESYGSLPLERLVRLAPDALIDSPYSEGTWSRAQQLTQHPALRRGLQPEIITLASRDTICGGPWTVGLVEQLAQARLRLQARHHVQRWGHP